MLTCYVRKAQNRMLYCYQGASWFPISLFVLLFHVVVKSKFFSLTKYYFSNNPVGHLSIQFSFDSLLLFIVIFLCLCIN